MESKTTEKVTVTAGPAGSGQSQSTVTRRYGGADFFVNKTNQIVYAIFGIIIVLLFLRIIFLLLGGNQVGIVSTIISITQIFVAPFTGIFPSPSLGTSYLDVAAIVAILIFAAAAAIIGVIVNLFSSKTE